MIAFWGPAAFAGGAASLITCRLFDNPMGDLVSLLPLDLTIEDLSPDEKPASSADEGGQVPFEDGAPGDP